MRSDELFAIVAAIGLLFGEQIVDAVKGKLPSPAPVTPVSVPDAQAQAAVAPVVAILKGHPSKATYAAYWSEFGDVIQKRPNEFKSVGDVVAQHRVASELFFDLDPTPVPGLANAMEQAIRGLVGEDDKSLAPADAVRVTNALTWACSQ